ncbi:hypothetical protein [Arthrobacter castelli]|uniref:hypothetical protein n=1 Tax=Arthrobacter castelli TaxID=271431 RepID=UPI000686489F|nr:hypothetical protein [Arthrobacter castelli]
MEDRIGGNRPDFGGKAEFVPAAAVLVGVCVFWLAGLLGGLAVLHSPGASMISVLVWLYIMLAAVALSVVAAALSIFDITRRLKRRRQGLE